jgi:hypothetical protein
MALIKILHKNNKVVVFYPADLSPEDTATVLGENPSASFSTNTVELPDPNEDFSNLLMPHHVVVEGGVARLLTGDELASAEAAEVELTALNELRRERDKRLAETDWWANSDLTMTQAQIDYRQALRDITNTYSSPDDVVWPTKPA